MSRSRQYEIRQAILEVLSRVYPGGRDLENLTSRIKSEFPELAVTRDDVLEHVRVLEAGEFVVDVKKGMDDAYWKATYTGIKQIRKESPKDPIVWGDFAR